MASPASAAGASVVSEPAGAAGAAVGAAPPQAVRAMLAMTRRLSKANILRIFLLLKNLEGFKLQIYCGRQKYLFLIFLVLATTSFISIRLHKSCYLTI
jgi:hypothetical protein